MYIALSVALMYTIATLLHYIVSTLVQHSYIATLRTDVHCYSALSVCSTNVQHCNIATLQHCEHWWTTLLHCSALLHCNGVFLFHLILHPLDLLEIIAIHSLHRALDEVFKPTGSTHCKQWMLAKQCPSVCYRKSSTGAKDAAYWTQPCLNSNKTTNE